MMQYTRWTFSFVCACLSFVPCILKLYTLPHPVHLLASCCLAGVSLTFPPSQHSVATAHMPAAVVLFMYADLTDKLDVDHRHN